MSVRPSRRAHVWAQRVGHQRQCARLTLDVAKDQVDQPRLEEQRGLAGRPFDRRAQPRILHRSQEEEALLDEAGEVRVRRHIGQVVGPQHDDQRSPTGVIDQFGEERSGVGCGRQCLLALVDDEHRWWVPPGPTP